MKIGMFDSGIGGITVLREFKKKFKGVNYVYLGDTAHLPYGSKSSEQVRCFSIENARILKEKKIDALIVACNTASSLALDDIQEVMGLVPVFGVVRPGVEVVLKACTEILKWNFLKFPERSQIKQRILVLATQATVQSHAYRDFFYVSIQKDPFLCQFSFDIREQACPVLVPFIEQGLMDDPRLQAAIQEYVRPYRQESGGESSGVALLACTHYPWVQTSFERALPGWKIINSAQAIAESFEESFLFQSHIKSLQPFSIEKQHANVSEKCEWIFTDYNAVAFFAKEWI